MSEKRLISITINGFKTKLDIDASKEEVYRAASKSLNQRIEYYNKRFRLSYEEILHMVAYEFAVEYAKLESEQNSSPLAEMEDITKKIEEALG